MAVICREHGMVGQCQVDTGPSLSILNLAGIDGMKFLCCTTRRELFGVYSPGQRFREYENQYLCQSLLLQCL